MCLDLNLQKTHDFTEENKGNHRIRVFKVVEKKDKGYFSIYRQLPIPQKGIYQSNRESVQITQNEFNDRIIIYGIHVCLTKGQCFEHTTLDDIILECFASIDDFVGINEQNEAVFTQITIPDDAKIY